MKIKLKTTNIDSYYGQIYMENALININRTILLFDKLLNDDNIPFEEYIDIISKLWPEWVSVNVKSKARYVIPLVKTNDGPVRINKISEKAARQIEEYLNSPKSGFTYFDFNFKPYETELTKYTSRDCNITMQDIYSEVNYNLRKNDFHNIDSISERKRLVNEELKKYVISKILELDSNISISDEMDLYFLVELLGRLIPKEEHFDTIRHFVHFVLQIASDMQGWYIVWYVKESNAYINNPEILKYNEMWDTLKTHQDENLVQTFKFVYDTFENHFMEKHHIKDYE